MSYCFIHYESGYEFNVKSITNIILEWCLFQNKLFSYPRTCSIYTLRNITAIPTAVINRVKEIL